MVTEPNKQNFLDMMYNLEGPTKKSIPRDVIISEFSQLCEISKDESSNFVDLMIHDIEIFENMIGSFNSVNSSNP